ncbi:MAG TPA: CAP domain-containing protein [Blastocatellia bacterium]|nr:CAP domain-containing protein [Blastocatellia bacterium]
MILSFAARSSAVLFLLSILCLPLLADPEPNDWQQLKSRYEQLSARLASLEWDGALEREARGGFRRRHDRLSGYVFHWSPYDKWETVCATGNVPLPNEVNGTYAWDRRYWMGFIYEALLERQPAGWECRGEGSVTRCRYAIGSEQATRSLSTEAVNAFFRRTEAYTRYSAAGELVIDRASGQILRFTMAAGSEDMFQPKAIRDFSLSMDFVRDPQFDLWLPSQTAIEVRRGRSQWRNVMAFSDYRLKSAPGTSELVRVSLDFEQPILAAINEARERNGLSPLRLDAKLVQAARVRSGQQLDWQAVGHGDGRRYLAEIRRAGYKPSYAGEVVAATIQGDDGRKHTPEEVVTGWLGSPSHRKQLLARGADEIGIALKEGTLNGRPALMIVALVAKKKGGKWHF